MGGDSWSCKVVPFHSQEDLIGGFQEVFKYALKFSEMAPADNWEAFQNSPGIGSWTLSGACVGWSYRTSWTNQSRERISKKCSTGGWARGTACGEPGK